MEIQKKICKDCGILKERHLAGMYNKKDKKWVDEFGRTWNGLRCPICHQLKMMHKMREVRTPNG